MERTSKKRLGRPPKPPAEKKERSRPLYILCDHAEREAIDSAALASGQAASTWAREVLLRAAKRAK